MSVTAIRLPAQSPLARVMSLAPSIPAAAASRPGARIAIPAEGILSAETAASYFDGCAWIIEWTSAGRTGFLVRDPGQAVPRAIYPYQMAAEIFSLTELIRDLICCAESAEAGTPDPTAPGIPADELRKEIGWNEGRRAQLEDLLSSLAALSVTEPAQVAAA